MANPSVTERKAMAQVQQLNASGKWDSTEMNACAKTLKIIW
jgi:hypothetical protein